MRPWSSFNLRIKNVNVPLTALKIFDSAVKHCVFNSKDRMFGAPPETWPEYFDRVWREGLYDEVIDFTKAIAIDIK